MEKKISLQINLSAGDCAYALMTVPALVNAHRRSIAESFAVVDLCRPQRTRFVDPERRYPEPQFSTRLDEIRSIAENLRAQGYFDRVEYLEPASSLIPRISKKYLADLITETHDCGGCGLMSYLAGIELAQHPFVLHYDADMLLYQQPGYSWTEEALALMQSEPSYVAATPRISPPFSSAKDAPSLHEGRPRRAVNGGWVNDWFSTRCFLLDRQKFEQFLPLLQGRLYRSCALQKSLSVPNGSGLWRSLAHRLFRPVYPPSPEILFFKRIGGSGGVTLHLSTERSWLLHPADKSGPFLHALPDILTAVAAGRFPEAQRGAADIQIESWRDFAAERSCSDIRSGSTLN